MIASQPYVYVVLFIRVLRVILNSESVDKILQFEPIENNQAIRSCWNDLLILDSRTSQYFH